MRKILVPVLVALALICLMGTASAVNVTAEGNGTIPAGTQLFSFDVLWNSNMNGLAMSDTYIWVAQEDAPRDTIYVHYHNGTHSHNITLSPTAGVIDDCSGLAYDDDTAGGPYLWYASLSDSKIYQFWMNGTEKFNFTMTYPAGLDWDGEHLWCTNGTFGTFVFEFYPNGTEITRCKSGYASLYGISYYSNSAGGPNLWI